MKLLLSDEMRAKLLKVRQSQMDELTSGRLCAVDDFFAANEVVRIKGGMGYGTYVGTDGRVIIWNHGEDEEPQEATHPKHVASVIVRWAKNVGMEELISLLPAKPPDGVICDFCGGERNTSLRKIFSQAEDEEVLCPKCQGLGWVTGQLVRST